MAAIDLTITFAGAPGRPGLYPEGAWESGRDYRRDAVVSHGNLIWRAKQLTRQEPAINCTDWDQWLDYRGLGQASAEAQAAAASALAASGSADAALANKNAAAASAQLASDKATAASGSADAALVNKNAAAASAQLAGDKATAASGSADAALVNKNAAAASAQLAGDKATAASGSADAALANKNAAAASAQLASDHATAASASASQSQQIAAGLSAGSYTLDGIDAQRVGAIISVPRGLYMSGGSLTTLASMLSVSSGAKWVMGPNGLYSQAAANTPALDYLSGSAGMRIEGSATTNYFINSEDPVQNGSKPANVNLTRSAAAALFGAFYYTHVDYLDGNMTNAYPFGSGGPAQLSVAAGDLVSFMLCVAKKASAPSPLIGIFGLTSGWGAANDYAVQTLYGAATLTFSGGRFFINNVSDTTFSLVRVTYRSPVAQTVLPGFYLAAQAATAGDWLRVGMLQFERGLGSSYIPTGASPVARAADIVSLSPSLTALLNAQASTVALRAAWAGNPRPANDVTSQRTVFGSLIIGRYGRLVGANGSTQVTAMTGSGAGTVNAVAPAATSSIALCAALSRSEGIKLAAAQGAIAKLAASDPAFGPMFEGADTSIGWGAAQLASAPPAALLLHELVVWPARGSDAGVVAQSRAYTGGA